MKVNLVSKTVGAGKFEGKTGEEIIVYCARVSSSRKDKFSKPEGLLNHCITNAHWSVFEKAKIGLEIETSKAIGIQMIRHKSFSFQEFSQRYAVAKEFEDVELRKQCQDNRQSSKEVFDPMLDMTNYISGKTYGDIEPANQIVVNHLNSSIELYNELIKKGVARECARMVLPMCTKTTIMMTGTARSWIHFLNVRDDEHAQKEIQIVAKEVKKIFIQEFPIISKALKWI